MYLVIDGRSVGVFLFSKFFSHLSSKIVKSTKKEIVNIKFWNVPFIKTFCLKICE